MNLFLFFSFWNLMEIYSSEARFSFNKEKEKKTVLVCPEGWKPYKDERCLKYFDNFENYTKAESLCKKSNSHLVVIDSEDKETFVLNLIPQTIQGNIWIGLKYLGNKKFGWIDNTTLSYTNWNDSKNVMYNDSVCAQLDVGNLKEKGKWLQTSCVSYKGPVLCETIQKWSQEQLQVKIMNLMTTVLPLDFIYVQLPKHKSPVEIWPWMEWEDVSHEYDSLFFRVTGERSGGWGKVQNQSSPTLRIDKRQFDDKKEKKKNVTLDVPYEPEWATAVVSHTVKRYEFATVVNLAHKQAEVVPANMAIKIWRRKN